MKKLILLTLCFFLLCQAQAQYKYKSQFRDKPNKGEILSVIGIGLIAAGAYNIGHQTTFKKVVTYTGGAMIFVGVTIDIKGNQKRRRR